jgi:hypothetical protein
MMSFFKRIANFVPAICIISGLIAVFVSKSELGWIFVGGGALLQALVLFSDKILRGGNPKS